jgi:hypothetical protein
MHADELSLSMLTVRSLLHEQFPELSDRSLTMIATEGTVHAIVRVGEDLVARFPRRPADPDALAADVVAATTGPQRCDLGSVPKLSSAHPDGGGTCIDTITAAVTVEISDDRGVAIVTMRTSIEGGQVRETSMSGTGSNWSATIGPYAAADIPVGPTFGIDTTIIARDAAGNEITRSFPRLGKIDGCPIS